MHRIGERAHTIAYSVRENGVTTKPSDFASALALQGCPAETWRHLHQTRTSISDACEFMDVTCTWRRLPGGELVALVGKPRVDDSSRRSKQAAATDGHDNIVTKRVVRSSVVHLATPVSVTAAAHPAAGGYSGAPGNIQNASGAADRSMTFAVLPQMPWHLSSDGSGEGGGGQHGELAAAAIARRLLEAQGYRVVGLDMGQWLSLGPDSWVENLAQLVEL